MRVTIINFALDCGGAERTVALLSNHWSNSGHDVNILTFSDGVPFFPLDPKVHRAVLHLASNSSNWCRGAISNCNRVLVIRRAIRQTRPDLVISFSSTTNILVLLAVSRLRIPTVICECTDPSRLSLTKSWRILRRLTYPHADIVKCLTEHDREWLRPIVKGQFLVLPNPVIPSSSGEVSLPLPGDKRVVSLGRLDPAKGFDVLIRAFGALTGKFPDWMLIIVGEGRDRSRLERLIADCRLQQRVHLLGLRTDPYSILRNCDLFVLSSLREGFSYALIEAMACGLAAISSDCSGPATIIRNEYDGLLCASGDEDALKTAMDRLMGNPEERKLFGSRAKQVSERFGLPQYLAKWDCALRKIGPQPHNVTVREQR